MCGSWRTPSSAPWRSALGATRSTSPICRPRFRRRRRRSDSVRRLPGRGPRPAGLPVVDRERPDQTIAGAHGRQQQQGGGTAANQADDARRETQADRRRLKGLTMPPRYAYWTIIAGGLPTAFRAAEREELLPTFQRIQRETPRRGDEMVRARQAMGIAGGGAHRAESRFRDRPRNSAFANELDGHGPKRPPREKRGRDWRPGGEHRDPRQKFIDAKKQRNATLRKDRWEKKNTPRPQSNQRPWDRDRRPARAQGTDEPRQPPRPRGPNREPRPSETPRPTPPPRPEEPTVPPPGPAEQGRRPSRRPFQPRGRFPKGPRR